MTNERSQTDSHPGSPARRSLRRDGGFTLTNLVFTMGLGGMMITVLSSHLAPPRQISADVEQAAEVEQGVRAAVTILTEEIDAAGACLPTDGPFVAMQAGDREGTDSLTVRVGRRDPITSACVRSVLTSRAARGDRQIEIESNGALRVGDRVLIAGAEDAREVHTITGTAGPSLIDIEPALEGDVPSSATVFALEERHYAIDRTGGRSVLTVQVNGAKSRSLVDGLTSLDLTYRLADGTVVSALSGDAEWRLVREISLAVTAESRAPGSDGVLLQRADAATVVPRHLL
jgi:hypothetical protein